jgi:hypothetical protein
MILKHHFTVARAYYQRASFRYYVPDIMPSTLDLLRHTLIGHTRQEGPFLKGTIWTIYAVEDPVDDMTHLDQYDFLPDLSLETFNNIAQFRQDQQLQHLRPLTAVKNLKAAAHGDKGIELTWEYDGPEHLGFMVERSSDEQTWTHIRDLVPTERSLIDEGEHINLKAPNHYRVAPIQAYIEAPAIEIPVVVEPVWLQMRPG